jgi:hypothetical protein
MDFGREGIIKGAIHFATNRGNHSGANGFDASAGKSVETVG